MHFNNMSVRTQLTLGFGVLVAIVLVVVILSVSSLSKANDSFKTHVQQVSARESSVNSILSGVKDSSLNIYGLVLVSEAADIEAGKKQVATAQEKTIAAIGQLQSAVEQHSDITDKDRNYVAAILNAELAYRPIAQHIVELALAEKKAEAIDRMNRELRPQLTILLNSADQYLKYSKEQAKESLNTAQDAYQQTRLIFIIISLVALILAAILGGIIIRSLFRALGEEPAVLGQVVQRIANGDLSQVNGATTAPAGSVLAAIGQMQEKLHQLVSQVASSAESIVTASTEITMGNEDLSRRTEAQASSLEQTSASMEQLTSTVKHNADNAHQGNLMATSASQVAQQGGDVVERVVSTMHEIASSSGKVTQIITVIEGIAFQTNILALNAAVEAARAGEQGRGFAVVAGEVRTLAQRSATAAKEIKDLIGESVDRINIGSKLVDEAGSTMREVVNAVKGVNSLMAEITLASSEQHTGIDQVNKAVVQMDEATQQNAALVEESAAAAESLRQQAHILLEGISAFDISRAGNRNLPAIR
ncbi:MAG: methyl-accepting chemotaxis protein [Rouxiella aceris]|uniref:methyl-accepting chemotaxis protein n=1 Tax=Rouxiella aceris TaxID=2703884 RepID=UPI00284F1A6F|nr:methyl-accepting chemotaxis protein [Rouxiella aceris]MDR3431998.1 methyl-accepting chemotaxis protein [Rouxiella aceris]